MRTKGNQLKTVLNLQPMDMLGIDFVGPIRPASNPGGKKYILIVVDYFSRSLSATATTDANGVVVKDFVTRIAKVMGWPAAIYCDNVCYFVKGMVAEELKKRGVLLFPAPITHPSSVGLAEKYVHLTMTALRTLLNGGNEDDRESGRMKMPLEYWNRCLDTAVFAINNRVVRTHGFSPAQLLLGFTPRGSPEDFTVRDQLLACAGMLEDAMAGWAGDRVIEGWEEEDEVGGGVSKDEVWVHLTGMDEKRQEAIDNISEAQRELERRYKEEQKGENPSKGDLVLLRRFVVDKDKGRKLEACWEGPY